MTIKNNLSKSTIILFVGLLMTLLIILASSMLTLSGWIAGIAVFLVKNQQLRSELGIIEIIPSYIEFFKLRPQHI